jgi:acetoacetyl-CoA synthetase
MTESPAAGGAEVLWTPSERMRSRAVLTRYREWLADRKGLRFGSYDELWSWSVTELEEFWASVWEFFDVRAARPYDRVLGRRAMPGAEWFPGAELNYAENLFRNATPEAPAILFRSERHPLREISWDELGRQVASVAAGLRAMGVAKGDRVVGYLPNIPEAAVAFLACASIGAIWSSCSPDFGTASVVDRFRQIRPKVLVATDGYQYNGRPLDRRAEIAALRRALPELEHAVLVSYLHEGAVPSEIDGLVPWDSLLGGPAGLRFEAVPFDHPLWVLYSSGTTGLPKAIVHGHGGIVVEHLKALALHQDLRPGDRYFWYTTTGWMMWNYVLGGLLAGATILLYDGSPSYPSLDVLWEFAEESGMTVFGTSASYLMACQKAGLEPGATHDLSALRTVGSTGSPLPPEGFDWVYERVGRDIWLASVSGGTDICSIFVAGCPLLPVRRGEIQCRVLGAKVEAFDEQGRPLHDEVGELVATEPLPSMPLFFWNDPGGERYRRSYFDMYPGVWRHGDWVRMTPSGGAVIYGRSDSTINRMGVRMGSGDIYGSVEEMPEIRDSLVVGVELPGGRYYMPLFVSLTEGRELDAELDARIRAKIRGELSPRHVPDEILALAAIPRTLNGKRLEVPVKRILSGVPVERAVNLDSITHPEMIGHFASLADELRRRDADPDGRGPGPADGEAAREG